MSARSASALIAVLREFAATFAAAGANPRSRHGLPWRARSSGYTIAPRGRTLAGAALRPARLRTRICPSRWRRTTSRAAFRSAKTPGRSPQRASPSWRRASTRRPSPRVRAQLSAELPADLFTRNVFDDLDARLGDAEAILRVAGAWGVPHWGEAASGGAHSELCERVAGFLREIAFDRNVAEAVEDETALAAWLATGYENMALAPTGQSVVPPSPADFERTGWSGAALSRVADDLERSAAPERAGRARKRAPAKAVPELIARKRAAATRLRRQDCQGR